MGIDYKMHKTVYERTKTIPDTVIKARKFLSRNYPSFYKKVFGYEDCRNIEDMKIIELYAIVTSTNWKKIKPYVLNFINHNSSHPKIKACEFTEKKPYIDEYRMFQPRSAKMIRGR